MTVFLSAAEVPDHLRGVEILSVGMDWPASTGPATFTAEHLADIVRAATEDPHVQPPRVRLGHSSMLNDGQPQHDPFAAIGDAEPSFGQLTNLRLVNDGAVLLADFTEVPEWLAVGAPSLFPSRSAEVNWAVQTPGGKRYSAVLTGVALLGAYLPAVQDLEDLQRLVEDGPSAPTQEASQMSRAAELSVSADEVRQRFNFDWAMDPESVFEDADGTDVDPYWWWAREIRIGPEEVIADDEAGHLWQVPFSVSDRDDVLFGDPIRVRVQYVAASGAPSAERTGRAVHVEASASVRQQAVTCFARRGQEVAASFTDRPTKPDPTAASTRPEREENDMPEITPEQLQRLQALPEDADQDAINAALTGEPETTDVETDPVEPAPVAASIATERGMTVDRDAFAALQADAAAGRVARQQQLEADRSAYLSAAVGRGKFPPAASAAYASQLAQGGEVERATREFIDNLPDGVVPLEPVGTNDVLEDGGGAYASLVGDDGLLVPGVSLLTDGQRARAARR